MLETIYRINFMDPGVTLWERMWSNQLRKNPDLVWDNNGRDYVNPDDFHEWIEFIDDDDDEIII